MKNPLGKLVAQTVSDDEYFIGMVIATRDTQFGFATYTVEWYNLDAKFDSIYEGYTIKTITEMRKDYVKIRRKICK